VSEDALLFISRTGTLHAIKNATTASLADFIFIFLLLGGKLAVHYHPLLRSPSDRLTAWSDPTALVFIGRLPLLKDSVKLLPQHYEA
jgi:hypothetical protein